MSVKPHTQAAKPSELKHVDSLFDPVLTLDEVATRLGVSRATVYSQLGNRDFVTFKIGRQHRMRLSSLLRWIALQERT